VKNLGQAVQPQPITALPGGDALILAQERTLSAGPATWLVAVVFLISVGAGLALSMLIFR